MAGKIMKSLAAVIALAGVPAASDADINLMCVGNSISEGAGLNEPRRSAPPIILAASLGEEPGIGSVSLINGGRSGSTTADWLPSACNLYPWFTALADSVAAVRPQALTVFSISLGTNDSACDRCTGAPATREDYRANLRTITDSLLRRYPRSIAVIHAPIWYSANTYNGARYLAEGQARLLPYRQEIKGLVAEYASRFPGRVWLGDTAAYSHFEREHLTEMQPEKGHAGVFYLHPNEKGARALASLWAVPVKKAITEWNRATLCADGQSCVDYALHPYLDLTLGKNPTQYRE